MNGWNPDWIGVLILVGYLGLVYVALGWFGPRSVPASDVRLDGRYRVARRRVRVVAIHPGTHFVTLVLHDVDTGERAAVTYHHDAQFKPRRFGP